MSKTTYPKSRSDLIARILQYQDLDSLLRLSVVLADLELGGHGCSLFLRNAEGNGLVLRESTVLTPFISQPLSLDFESGRTKAEKIRKLLTTEGEKPEHLNRTLTSQQTEGWSPDLTERLRGFGLTRWAIHFRCPMVIEKIHEDERWSRKKKKDATQHCELSPNEIGSIAIYPFGHEVNGLPKGVLRLVRKKGRRGLAAKKLDWLKWFTSEVNRCMEVAASLTNLMDVGAKLEVADFGESLVQLLKKDLRVTGCSIFLELGPAVEGIKIFQCIATTGLYQKGLPISKEKAQYLVDKTQEQIESVTGWVLRNGQLLAVDSVQDFDPERFPGLTRKPGYGTFNEAEPNDPLQEGGPLLISPLFLYQGQEVAGAIRVVRPREEGQDFQAHEQLLFLDISRRLSKILTNLNLRKVTEELIGLYNKPDEVLQRVPFEVSRLLGVEGCSVFRLRSARFLVLAASKGLLARRTETIEYDITDPERRGWTGWVAYKKRALRLNSAKEANRVDPDDPPKHSPADPNRPCEVVVGRADRFLAVPIFRDPEDPTSEVLGVIRAPRNKKDPPFEEVHQSILVSFAARLSVVLNMAQRTATLQAVAELAHPVDMFEDSVTGAQQTPASIATEVVEKTVDVLIDKVGFAYAAIYKLDLRTDKLRRLHGRSTLAHDPIPELTTWEDNLGFDLYPIQLGQIRLGTIYYSPYQARPTDRQKNLVALLAGICASALYNSTVFEKLQSIRQGLVGVGVEMTGDSPLTVKLKKIANVAADVTLADYVIIHEYLAPAPNLEVSAGQFRETACGGSEEPKLWKSTSFKPDAVPYKVVLRKEPLFESVAKDSEVLFHAKEEPNFIVREGISSVAALPLNANETCVGCIFFNFRVEQGFAKQQRNEIQMMSEYAAMAIYQGRLLAETKQLVREKSNLLRYADHSLAQPLNALWSYLGNLADGIYHSQAQPQHLTSAEAFEGSELARKAEQQYKLCQYIIYLVENFLQIDRLESGRLFEIKPQPGNSLTSVCEHAVEVSEAYMGGPIVQNIQPHVEGYFDQNAAKMAILNILINAVKCVRGSSHGVIKLSLSTIRRGDKGWAKVCIDDSGPGVPENERDKIFDMGYTRNPRSPGLGIGLFLAKGYVEAQGGTIEVEDSDLPSSSSKRRSKFGARFVISLPLTAEESKNDTACHDLR